MSSGKDTVRLLRFSNADFELYSRLVFNRQVMDMNYGRVFTAEEAAFFFRHMTETNRSTPEAGYFKVFSESTGSYLGLGGLVPGEEERTAEAEYMVLPEFWHQGYGTAILTELLRLGAECGFKSVSALTDPGNKYSRRILENASFMFEKEYSNSEGDPVAVYIKRIR